MSSITAPGRSTGQNLHSNGTDLALAVAAPLAVAALVYGLWSVSDRLPSIGPLDRATFGWAVVVPIWALAPVAAAIAWRRRRRAESWSPLRRLG